MIRRLLFLVLAVAALMWWLRNLTRRIQLGQQRAPGVDERARPVRDLGPMVRDHVCNTFLPKSRALTLRVGSDERYFCSEECRQKFLAERAAHSA